MKCAITCYLGEEGDKHKYGGNTQEQMYFSIQ